MNLLATGPNLQGISDAVNNAAKALDDPQANVRDIAKQLVTDMAKALDPQSKPEDTLNKLVNSGIDSPAQRALGAYMSVFKFGMDMCFSGIVNQGMSKNFTSELLKFLAPEAMQQFEGLAAGAGLRALRAWDN